jgi:hypothetical protein
MMYIQEEDMQTAVVLRHTEKRREQNYDTERGVGQGELTEMSGGSEFESTEGSAVVQGSRISVGRACRGGAQRR